MSDFNRYSALKVNGKVGIIPYVEIKKRENDKYIVYNKKTMRFDNLSYKYYNNPNYGWLIMQANPEYGSIENFIPNGVLLRIPLPLDEILNDYTNVLISQ